MPSATSEMGSPETPYGGFRFPHQRGSLSGCSSSTRLGRWGPKDLGARAIELLRPLHHLPPLLSIWGVRWPYLLPVTRSASPGRQIASPIWRRECACLAFCGRPRGALFLKAVQRAGCGVCARSRLCAARHYTWSACAPMDAARACAVIGIIENVLRPCSSVRSALSFRNL